MPSRLRELDVSKDRRPGLLTIALAILIALVLARALMLESIRDLSPFPSDLGPGPHAPGAASGLVLDLLAMLPALAVLFYRARHADFRLRRHASLLLAGPLAIWMAASVFWSADKFAALVSAAHFIAALVVLWSVVQLVRSWQQFRVVAALAVGLLLALIAKSAFDQFLELPQLRQEWSQKKDTILAQHHWTEGSYEAGLYEHRILSGQLMGFTASPNTFAAELVLLLTIAAAMVIQFLKDRRPRWWLIVPALPILVGVADSIYWRGSPRPTLDFYRTGCRAALGTIGLTIVLLSAVALGQSCINRHRRALYVAAVVLFAATVAFVVEHGRRYGTLVHPSLTFRWDYWTGAARVFMAHPLRGVGWENFSLYYLAARVPRAAESIRDPHNFLIRFFVELGIPGGVLAVAFFARFAWELSVTDSGGADSAAGDSRPPSGQKTPDSSEPIGLLFIAAVVLMAIVINIAAAIDFTQDGVYLLNELVQCLMYGGCLLIAAIACSITRWADPRIDGRPAPWLAAGIAVALGIFLIHSLIEFSLFETGPLFLVALLGGAALAIKGDANPYFARNEKMTVRVPPGSVCFAWAALVGGGVAWAAMAVAVVIPVVRAESYAGEAADDIRFGDHRRLLQAVDDYAQAWEILHFNDDYAAGAARAMQFCGTFKPDAVLVWYDRAIAANPQRASYYMDRAQVRAQNRDTAALDDLQTAVDLDPNSVGDRLAYAQYLVLYNRPDRALDQFRTALRMDSLLDKAEPKRLSLEQIEEVEKQMQFAEAAAARAASRPVTQP